MQKLLEYTPIIISLFSLLIAGIALYMGQYRKSSIRVVLGPDIHIYHPSDGGTAFYLPMIFTNKSPTRGFVEEIFIQEKTPDGEYFTMKWLEVVQMTFRDWKYELHDRAKPFTIDGYDTLSKVYWFLWPASTGDFNVKKGKYSITAMISSEKGRTPKIKETQSFLLDSNSETFLQKRREDRDPTTLIHYFTDDSFTPIHR